MLALFNVTEQAGRQAVNVALAPVCSICLAAGRCVRDVIDVSTSGIVASVYPEDVTPTIPYKTVASGTCSTGLLMLFSDACMLEQECCISRQHVSSFHAFMHSDNVY